MGSSLFSALYTPGIIPLDLHIISKGGAVIIPILPLRNLGLSNWLRATERPGWGKGSTSATGPGDRVKVLVSVGEHFSFQVLRTKILEVFPIPLLHTLHLVPQQGPLLALTSKHAQNLAPSHLLHHGHLEPPT